MNGGGIVAKAQASSSQDVPVDAALGKRVRVDSRVSEVGLEFASPRPASSRGSGC